MFHLFRASDGRAAILGLVAATVSVAVEAQQPPVFVQDLIPRISFGGVTSCDLEGDWIALGAEFVNQSTGEVFLYRRDSSGWSENAIIQAPDAALTDKFGSDLAFDGETLVVGASSDTNQNGMDAGAAYVYVKSGALWLFQQKLVASNGQAFNNFGHAVDVSGDAIVVGSVGGNHVYVFERTGTVWSEVLKVNFGNVGLGRSVAIDGTRMVAGAWLANPLGIGTTGAVYVYERGPVEWELADVIVHDDPVPGDNLGWAVDVQGDCIAASDVMDVAGRVTVFTRAGGSWSQEAVLLPPGGLPNDQFGWYLALDGDRLLASDDPSSVLADNSSFFLFRRSGTTWDAGAEVPTSAGGLIPLALEGHRIVVGGLADFPGGNGAIYAIPDGPSVYCTAKANSQGCLPSIGWTGSPTTGGPDDFVVTASNVLPSKPGLYFFGLSGPAALPFFGGTLCVQPPLARTPVQMAGPGVRCNGAYAFLFAQSLMAQMGLLPGDRLHGQYWARDPAHPDGTGVALSDALEFVLLP